MGLIIKLLDDYVGIKTNHIRFSLSRLEAYEYIR